MSDQEASVVTPRPTEDAPAAPPPAEPEAVEVEPDEEPEADSESPLMAGEEPELGSSI